MHLFRYLLGLLGVLLAMPFVAILIMVIRLPISFSAIVYLLAGALLIAGLIAVPLFPQASLLVITLGLIAFILIAGTRWIAAGQNSSSEIQLITLPEERGTRWINTLIDEQDSLLLGEELFHRIGGDSPNEHRSLASAISQLYSQMRKQGNFSSPILSTYLNQQQPAHFDTVIIHPEAKPKFAVVFLHGYMGNVTAQCWVIGQAVKKLGGMTVCPSTSWRGQWWQPEGQLIIRNTLQFVRDQGIEKIYLGGFSNGGFSIGHLASQLAGEKGLSGLIFIDGFINGSDVRELNLPVLIIQGTQDERVPAEAARQFAREVGNQATYVELDSDHFLIMKQSELVQGEITKWLTCLIG